MLEPVFLMLMCLSSQSAYEVQNHFLLLHGLDEGYCRCSWPYHKVWSVYFGF